MESVAVALQRLLLMRAVVRLSFTEPPAVCDDAFVNNESAPQVGGWASGFGLRGAEPLTRALGLLQGSQPRERLLLTPVGRVLSRLPVDVGVGKMLLLALVFGVQSAAVVLAGAMGLHAPRVQRHGERGQSSSFDHRLGDPFTTHKVYQAWLAERSRRQGGSDAQSRRWAREHGIDERTLFELNKLNVQLCDLLKDGAGRADGAGAGLGGRLRRDRMARLEAAMTGAGAAAGAAGDGGLSTAQRAALQAELAELQQKESLRQRRRLTFEDGEGALVEDERGLGYVAEERTLGGYDSDGDAANASGGEGNWNRELNRRPRKTGKGSGKVRPPKDDGLAERMRRRNLEFELRYGSHSHTTKALEPLSSRQEELLQLVVACALYPNLALPHENNKERSSADCVFHTRQVPFVNLHPSSSFFPEISSALAQHEGLCFGSILQTHMPFMTHVTRVPFLPLVLLGAAVVDVAADCRMLICDEWLQLVFEDAEEVLDLLEEASGLRRSMQHALDQEVADLFQADCDDDVSEDLLSGSFSDAGESAPPRLRQCLEVPAPRLRGKELEDRALAFWRLRIGVASWQPLMPNEYAAFTKGDEAKGGHRSHWLRFGTVSEHSVRPEDCLVSDHLAVAWKCPRCLHTFRFNRKDIQRHQKECDGDGDAKHEASSRSSHVVTSLPDLVSSAPGSARSQADELNSGWRCDQCSACLPIGCSALDILRHRRSHGM